MGHKVHPVGFRLGVIRDWEAKWFAEARYSEYLKEDVKIRSAIRTNYREAGISAVDINRQAKDVTVTLHTARPGIVIGRGGQRVDEMRVFLEKQIDKRVRLNIQEIRQPELDAYLVARTIADQIERRVAYRRAMKQAIFRTMQAGAKGIRISCAGRLGDAEIARRQNMHEGQVPLHTLRADIDYGFTEAHTQLGRIGVKAWIYKGQILPEPKAVEPVEAEAKAEVAAAPAAGTGVVVEKPAEVVAEKTAGVEEKGTEGAAVPRVKRVRKATAEKEAAEPAVAPETKEKPAEEAVRPAARKTKKAETGTAGEKEPEKKVRASRKPAQQEEENAAT